MLVSPEGLTTARASMLGAILWAILWAIFVQEGEMIPLAVAHAPTERFLSQAWAVGTTVAREAKDITRSLTFAEAASLAARRPLYPLCHFTVSDR